ncbi:ketopantoate reductase family protein [Microbacterium sp. DT81.1]|uniref:ketopantoate reductase family protein n=1 Tax=Microbacterium sp. DT81.1 TaxID=3393413 RepID=UPI003CF21E8C
MPAPGRICVYGAGAVGGHIAGRLGAAGLEISVVARGEQLGAIRERGLRVETPQGTLTSFPRATDRPQDLGPQDLVLVAVKAPSLPGIAEHLATLAQRDGLVVFVGNGIPWWYFHGDDGPFRETRVQRLDPAGTLWDTLGPQRAVGGVAYTASTTIAPGVIRAENAKNRLIVGRPDGAGDERLDRFASALNPTGLETMVTTKIRDAIWTKLISNTVGGSLGVLTASATKDVMSTPALAAAAQSMAEEVVAVARAHRSDPGDASVVVSKLGTSAHVQSIVQDLLSGRPMEIDALFRAPLDLAAMMHVPTPYLEFAVELATQRARATGQYRDPARN